MTIWLGGLCLALYLFMLYFRAFIYADMYKAPDDPYGISDIIELLLGSQVLILFIITGVVAINLFIKGNSQSKKSAALLVLFYLALYFAYSPLHTLPAKYSSNMPNKSFKSGTPQSDAP